NVRVVLALCLGSLSCNKVNRLPYYSFHILIISLPGNSVPGPYCEYRQDSRLVGSTYPNAVIYVSTEDRRRSNVSLVSPTLCRLTWAPMADEKPYTYTCRVYQGSSWKENRILPICSAISVMFRSAPWLLSLVMSLPVAVGLLITVHWIPS
uniref:Uncharacterized protein n=1 Tax=Mastacembelus armatus TaxID=205130 RepID=A0A7N8WWA3_9TELE